MLSIIRKKPLRIYVGVYMSVCSCVCLRVAYVYIKPNISAYAIHMVSCITNPASILYKSIAGRYRPVSYPDGPITARYSFIKNAYWEMTVPDPAMFYSYKLNYTLRLLL